MDSILWLVISNVIIWAGFGIYLAIMSLRQRNLKLQLQQLELMDDERDS